MTSDRQRPMDFDVTVRELLGSGFLDHAPAAPED
jgi:hypothetical protein